MQVEQNLILFLASAVLISLSGVLSPGPMTAAVIQQGARSRHAGIYISLGHGLVELPLILLIFFGASRLFEIEWVRIVIGIAGGLYLIYMGIGLMRPADLFEDAGKRVPTAFYTGIIMSIGNPYFLLWWATIGLGLVLGAFKFGLTGLLLFAAVHWLCDLLWLTFLGAVSFKGIQTFGQSLYKKVCILCGVVLLFYGGVFIFGSIKLIIKA